MFSIADYEYSAFNNNNNHHYVGIIKQKCRVVFQPSYVY